MALGKKALTAIILALVILSLTMLPTWSMAFLILLGMIASAFDSVIEVTTTIPILPVQDPAPTVDASGDAPVDALALSVDALGLAEDALALTVDAPALTVDAPVDASGDAPVDALALSVDALALTVDSPALTVDAPVDASGDAPIDALALSVDALALTVDAPVDASAQSSAVVATGIEMRRRRRGTSECEVEEERCGDVSTELVLGYDPYKIKKKLKKSDLSHHLSRLMIPQAGVATYVLPCMDEETARRAKSGEGAKVVVWDADTRSEHRLVFASWGSESYILRGGWSKEFVQRRGLAEGDKIGILWDPIASKFNFSLLHKAKRLGSMFNFSLLDKAN